MNYENVATMLFSLNKKSLIALYFSVLRPCITLGQTNMSTVKEAKDIPEIYSVAYITVPSTDIGKDLAHKLVTNKLAACVNIIPQIISVYEWQNKINEDNEALLMVKTRTSLVTKLSDFVRANHPYEICEVISLPIHNGNPPYLKWIGDTLPDK